MNIIELILFISVVIVGIALLRWAHILGIEHKTFYENDATKRIELDLRRIHNEIHKYAIYRYSKSPLFQHSWGKSHYDDIKKEILHNCTKYSGRGVWYAEASYSLGIDDAAKTIYYVIGVNDFDFSNKII